MRRRIALGDGEVQLVAAACARAFGGVDTASGQVLDEAGLVERAGWLTGLVRGAADGLVAGHWNRVDLARLASGTDEAGAALPSQAWMALRRLGWPVTVPEGVYVPDRVARIAQEQAGRTLRAAWWRAQIVDAVVSTWPADPDKRTPAEWEALRTALPEDADGTASAVLRARTRQITEHLARHGRLPSGLTDLETAPGAGGQVVLAAVDRQLATLERCDEDPTRYAVLSLRLPTGPAPASRRDWTVVHVRFRLPHHVPATAVLCSPTLRIRHQRLLLDIPYAHAVPKTSRTGHTVTVAFDWGLNTLLTGGTVRLTDEVQPRVGTDGQPVFLRVDGILAKADRLRLNQEHVQARIDRLETLLASRAARGVRPDPWVAAKHAVLLAEREYLGRRRRRINEAIAKTAARFMVDHAIAAGASVIHLEDLRDMEARGKGRTLNLRLSQTVRGQIVTHTRHRAAVHGIAVVTVPARGTSKHCPRCLTPLRHHKAPNDGTSGWAWATCPNPHCGYSTGRDNAAWQRIGARGLTHQTHTRTDRASGAHTVRQVIEALDLPVQHHKADRTKSGPTTKRPVPGKRHRVPAPPGSTPGGKRPAGRTPTHPIHHRRWRRGQQGPNTIGTPARHRPGGARLGAGFHHHAHATPTRARHSRFPGDPETPGSPRKPKPI